MTPRNHAALNGLVVIPGDVLAEAGKRLEILHGSMRLPRLAGTIGITLLWVGSPRRTSPRPKRTGGRERRPPWPDRRVSHR